MTEAVRYEVEGGIVNLVLDDPNQSANTMNADYAESMGNAVDQLVKDIANDPASIKGVIVSSAKKTFFAGGDLELMTQATPADAERLFDEVETIKATLRKLETSGKPVVAAINGAALGGGLEIALACHHRIAVDGGYQVGLPEATLGLLPGGGGVTRTVRMFGISDALMKFLLQGQQRVPAKALAEGLVDGSSRPRTADPGRQGLDRGQCRQRRSSDAAMGPQGLPDAGRTALQPQARGVPAGLPGQSAQADQGRALQGAAQHHVGCGRGRSGRLRHRVPDRVALPGRAHRRPAVQEHDPGVLLRPGCDQRWQVASPRHCAHQG
ncbi:enoyl-CoA hydratase/isomerase family protein [Aeromicrobium sp. UC242_57]|uniref:enoyl-CoA hydratase/isomerase family protein n=1 Tax=Aeromicrobium sp. UC242_57 TaxID=3374624 RepID=UPI0037A25741